MLVDLDRCLQEGKVEPGRGLGALCAWNAALPTPPLWSHALAGHCAMPVPKGAGGC